MKNNRVMMVDVRNAHIDASGKLSNGIEVHTSSKGIDELSDVDRELVEETLRAFAAHDRSLFSALKRRWKSIFGRDTAEAGLQMGSQQVP